MLNSSRLSFHTARAHIYMTAIGTRWEQQALKMGRGALWDSRSSTVRLSAPKTGRKENADHSVQTINIIFSVNSSDRTQISWKYKIYHLFKYLRTFFSFILMPLVYLLVF